MNIVVNDEPLALPAALTLTALLEQLDHQHPGIALAVNRHIVPRERWANWFLQEGDELVIFQAIAGG